MEIIFDEKNDFFHDFQEQEDIPDINSNEKDIQLKKKDDEIVRLQDRIILLESEMSSKLKTIDNLSEDLLSYQLKQTTTKNHSDTFPTTIRNNDNLSVLENP